MTQPASVPANGTLKVVWVATIASPTAPTQAELTAGSVVDLSCYLTGDGFNPSTDEQTIEDDRLCSRQTFERRGKYTDMLEITYVFNPDSPGDDAAYQTLIPGTLGYIVARWGVDFEDPLATGDIVDVIPAECGIQVKQPPEDNGVLKAGQKLFVRSSVERDVTVA